MASDWQSGRLEEIHAHAESTYPEECCGLLIADRDKDVVDSDQR